MHSFDIAAAEPVRSSPRGSVLRRPRALMVMRPQAYRDQFGHDELAQLQLLAEVGEPVYHTRLDTPEARAQLATAEVLITSWGCPTLDARVLDHAPKLALVLHAAGTVRRLVSDVLWERGIQVSNCADQNAIPVAEYTLAAIIMGGKKVPFIAAAARSGRDRWLDYRDNFGPLSNLNQTIGIIGYSRIGRRVVDLLRTLEVTVLVHDPLVDADEIRAAGAEPVSLHQLLTDSDTVSIHAPSLPETQLMIGARELALMADRTTLINTARGALVDTRALEAECASGRLNAILDVTEPEPLPSESILYDLPNVVVTPHIAGSQGNETRRMSRKVLDELERYAKGFPLANPITREQLEVMA